MASKRALFWSSADFDEFYWYIDNHGTLIIKWVDNNFVLLVSTINYLNENVLVSRKKSPAINMNRSHIKNIWASSAVVKVKGSRITNKYNNWLSVGNLADQQIYYCR